MVEYSEVRNPDAEAICDLAMYNYIEVNLAKTNEILRAGNNKSDRNIENVARFIKAHQRSQVLGCHVGGIKYLSFLESSFNSCDHLLILRSSWPRESSTVFFTS